jgi:hypothetical protein
MMGGKLLTKREAKAIGRHCLLIHLIEPLPMREVLNWVAHNKIQSLNIADP